MKIEFFTISFTDNEILTNMTGAMDNIATLTTAIVRHFSEWNLVEKS